MAGDESRNFRSYYYEKFGFRGVEEKKSIEIILKENRLDKEKLSQFCLRFPVPSMHRALVWKVLLDVLPPVSSTHEFITKQRQETYENISRSLKITRRIDSNTPRSQVFLRMFLVEECRMKLTDDQYSDPENHDFLAVALVMEKLFNNEMDIYWLTKHFIKVLKKLRENYNSLRDCFCQNLSQTDNKLYKHLDQLQTLNSLPLLQWFSRCFAGTLHESSLGTIWDKVIGGSSKVLVFVAVAILSTCQLPLLNYQTSQEITQYISRFSEEASKMIVQEALDKWTQHGEIGRIKNN
ncbi:TBC1 domain member 7 [Chamberlinius hualienensis]